MKHFKVNHIMIALLLSAAGAFATSKQSNILDICATVPSTSGPSINGECPYSISTLCCYISAGSSSQYVTQSQGGSTITIRRNSSAMVSIFGVRQ